jgi:hypothetical protein
MQTHAEFLIMQHCEGLLENWRDCSSILRGEPHCLMYQDANRYIYLYINAASCFFPLMMFDTICLINFILSVIFWSSHCFFFVFKEFNLFIAYECYFYSSWFIFYTQIPELYIYIYFSSMMWQLRQLQYLGLKTITNARKKVKTKDRRMSRFTGITRFSVRPN